MQAACSPVVLKLLTKGVRQPSESANLHPYSEANRTRNVCFVAIERNTKLILNFTLGRRTQQTTDTFIEGLRDAIEPRGRFQITTDGFIPYISASTTTLGHRVDFARLTTQV